MQSSGLNPLPSGRQQVQGGQQPQQAQTTVSIYGNPNSSLQQQAYLVQSALPSFPQVQRVPPSQPRFPNVQQQVHSNLLSISIPVQQQLPPTNHGVQPVIVPQINISIAQQQQQKEEGEPLVSLARKR